MKGKTDALKAVLPFLHLWKHHYYPEVAGKAGWKYLKPFAFKHMCYPEYCYWIMTGSKRPQMHLCSKHSVSTAAVSEQQKEFLLLTRFFLSTKRHLPLILSYNTNALLKLKKSANPQRLWNLSLHYTKISKEAVVVTTFFFKHKNNRFTEMISHLLGFKLFCQESLPRKWRPIEEHL